MSLAQRTVAAAFLALACACGSGAAPGAPLPRGDARLRLAPPALPLQPSQPLAGNVRPSPAPGPGLAPRSASVTVDAKLLVLASDGNETDLGAIRSTLDYLGTPYEVWIATAHPGELLPTVLSSGLHGFYQGVILTTGDLGHETPGGWQSALAPAEWQALAAYEQGFAIREVSFYTFPTPDYGLNPAHGVVDPAGQTDAHLTAAGAAVFGYLAPTGTLPIRNAYTYLATAADGEPLLVDAAGDALAVTRFTPDGRHILALTFDGSSTALHSVALGHGIVSWVTRGVFLGERHAYLSAQVDDLFIDDDEWDGSSISSSSVVYRITGPDLMALDAWQEGVRARPVTAAFAFDFPFNGSGTSGIPNDTLTPAAIALQGHFKWINHTYDHDNLDATTLQQTTTQIARNNTAAQALGFTSYSPAALVTPDVSGLSNPNAMLACANLGVRFVVSDTSVPGQGNPGPNLGIPNALQPSVFEVPRRPTNLFYNVSNPGEWVAEYNFIYRGFWGRDLTYPEILDKESDVLVEYLLRGEIDPWMFHEINLRAYDGVHSLLGDLLDATMAKYQAVFALPIASPTFLTLGETMQRRTGYAAASVQASIIPGPALVISSPTNVIVPVTGPHQPTSESYGGQWITWVPVPAGGSVTLALP